MKGGKVWGRKKEKDDMRWKRNGSLLALQWKNHKIVTMLCSTDVANEHVTVNCKIKTSNKWKTVEVKQPMAIHKYNAFMNRVDKSHQILNTNVLSKCVRWWKTLFFHMIDIALVNGYILFQSHRKNNPDNELLKRPQRYCLQNFREKVLRSLAKLEEYGIPKLDWRKPPSIEPSVYETVHIPTFSIEKRNCKVCYKDLKRELKVKSYCSAPQCSVYIYCINDKNCFAIWHSKDYHC